MKNIISIMKKELSRVFKDPKLILLLILPGILVFVMYSFMGMAFENAGADDKPYTIYVANLTSEFDAILQLDELSINAEYTVITLSDLETNQEKLKTGEITAIIVFEEDFGAKVGIASELPNIDIYYNPTDNTSSNCYAKVAAAVSIYQSSLNPEVFTQKSFEIFDEKNALGTIFAQMFPLLMLVFLYSGCMSLAPDSIAGEKERGTISTLLMTPVKRHNIAIGKMAALSILSLISAVSSFLGTILSMPKMMGLEVSAFSIYGAGEYIMILLVLISTVFIIIGLMSVISAYAKNIKEASMYLMPLMIVVMVLALLTMFTSSSASGWYLYLIPIYNSAQALYAIFTFNLSTINLMVTIVSNIVYMIACVFILSKMFNNEKIMFAK